MVDLVAWFGPCMVCLVVSLFVSLRAGGLGKAVALDRAKRRHMTALFSWLADCGELQRVKRCELKLYIFIRKTACGRSIDEVYRDDTLSVVEHACAPSLPIVFKKQQQRGYNSFEPSLRTQCSLLWTRSPTKIGALFLLVCGVPGQLSVGDVYYLRWCHPVGWSS